MAVGYGRTTLTRGGARPITDETNEGEGIWREKKVKE